MQIDVVEAARLLMVSEKTVMKWIKKGDLPAYKVNDRFRFNKSELFEWAVSRKIEMSPDLLRAHDDGATELPRFAEALAAGGIHYGVAGADKAGVLESVVGRLSLPAGMDRSFLLSVLLARESLGSTGIGDGIAIPHVRNPIVLGIPQPLISLCFLAAPIEFDSVDGKPVHTLFTLVSPTVRTHLHLLSRLTFALRKPEFSSLISARAETERILAAAEAVS
jgi:PTS system nitrogen regulatory IIA component